MHPARASLLERALLLVAAAALVPVTLVGDQTVQVAPGNSFSPAMVTVAPGETVTWQFNNNETHTTTSDSQTGPETWDSGARSTGTFSHTFQTTGTYPYHCAVHSFPGGTMMNGVVEVSGAGATPTPTTTPIPPASPTPTSTLTPPAATPTTTSIPPASPTPTSTLTPPGATPTSTPIPPSSPTPTSTLTPPAPGPSATPISGAGPAAGIPDLDDGVRVLLALLLAAAGIAALLFSHRR